MKLLNEKNFRALQHLSGINDVGKIIIDDLFKKEIIEDCQDFYGAKLRECIDRDINIKEIEETLHKINVKATPESLDFLLDVVLMGDGDCPKCGGELEYEDGEYFYRYPDGLDGERDEETIWEKYKCKACGHEEIL